MRKPVVLALCLLLAVGALSAGVAIAHTPDECTAVRANAAAQSLTLDAAEHQAGLTSGQRTWIANYRGILAKALAHCPAVTTTLPPTTTAAPTTTTAAPTTTTTSTSTTTTTTAPTTTTTTTTLPPSGGKPNATNTGVPAGTTLTPSGSITVTTSGTVIQNRLVTGCIYVRAPNVTIKNTKILSGCFAAIDIQPWNYNATNLTITDVEVDGRTQTDNCISWYNYTATRVNLHHCVDGAKIGDNTTIRDSYIHDLSGPADAHKDAVQDTGGSNTLVDHVVLGGPVMMGDEFGSLVNVTIQNSWLEGGLWGGWNQSTGTQPQNMRVLNNVIGNNPYGFCCAYVAPSTIWSGNVTPGGAPIPHP